MKFASALLAQVARDRARSEENLRKREDYRGAPIEDVKDGNVTLVTTEEKVAMGDVDTDGGLVELPTVTVTGWKTNAETEAGIQHICKNALAASATVRSLLNAGCYQIIVESSRRPEPLF